MLLIYVRGCNVCVCYIWLKKITQSACVAPCVCVCVCFTMWKIMGKTASWKNSTTPKCFISVWRSLQNLTFTFRKALTGVVYGLCEVRKLQNGTYFHLPVLYFHIFTIGRKFVQDICTFENDIKMCYLPKWMPCW